MNPGEVRSDLIGAWIMRQWFAKHIPHLVESWSLSVNAATKAAAERVISLLPALELVFVGQAPIAKTAIDRWSLTEVAYLAAGTPTPFSPRPDQLRYYTDGNPAAVAEAAQAGYNTLVVDVYNSDHLKQLDGVTTLIATGLTHFLPDQAARRIFAILAQSGFQRLIFNNANQFTDPLKAGEAEGAHGVTDQFSRLGMQLYFRSPDQIRTLLDGYWQLKDAYPLPEFYKNHELGPFFEGRNFYTIYDATAR
jgi:hypothetical protein